jgi:glycogen operon protein
VSRCIAFRHAHPVLRGRQHPHNRDVVGSGWPDISWHGEQPWRPDWSHGSRRLAFMLCGRHAWDGNAVDADVYVAMNMHWDGATFGVPRPRHDSTWRVFANTGAAAPADVFDPGSEPPLPDDHLLVGPRSVVVLVSPPPLHHRS